VIVNQYFFVYRNTTFVIFAQSISEAFEPYKRILSNKSGSEDDFKNNLLKEPQDLRDCLMLCGKTISRNMLNDILKPYQKSYIPSAKSKIVENTLIQPVKEPASISEELSLDSAPPIIRKRGRPPGSKNKLKVVENIDSLFE
jgi:hypothetical protein